MSMFNRFAIFSPSFCHLFVTLCHHLIKINLGYYRNTAGYCVPYDQCPPEETGPCGMNEYFNWCGNQCLEGECSCVQTYGYHCLAHKRSTSCPTVCQPRCECQAGFVRDDKPGSSTYGKCVTISACLTVPTTTPVAIVTTTAPYVPPITPRESWTVPCKIFIKYFKPMD